MRPARILVEVVILIAPSFGNEGIVDGMEGTKIVAREPGYLYVQFTTRLMKYVDDAEFWFDPVAGVIHVRSASRLGSSDLGVNRKRIEFIRQELQNP